jgi:hypothetical protein
MERLSRALFVVSVISFLVGVVSMGWGRWCWQVACVHPFAAAVAAAAARDRTG